MFARTNDTHDDESLLAEYANNKTWEFIPAMVFVGVFIIAGVIGNWFTFIYFGFAVKRKPSTLFIATLAAIDFATCILMCDQILSLCLIVTFKSVIGCRLYIFLNYWFVYNSALMLVVISVDRYRKLCRPFKCQFTAASSKIAIGITIICALLIAVKNDFIADVQRVNITNTNNRTFQGYHCFHTTKDYMSIFVTSFYLLDLGVLVALVIYFVVVYGLIIRSLIRLQFKSGSNLEINRNDNGALAASVSVLDRETETNEATSDLNVGRQSNVKRIREKRNISRTKHMRMKSESKLTLLMIIITGVFVISYIPYFVVVLYINLVLKIPRYELNVGIQILYRFFIINSAVNPYIFFIFTSAYRRFVRGTCRSCCLGDKLK